MRRPSPWHLVLAPMALLFALPLLWLIVSSFMTDAEINRFPPTIIPDGIHFDGYDYVFATGKFGRWFLNSTIVAGVTVFSNLVFCSLAGYAFARMHFRGSRVLLAVMLATLVIPFQLTMIPTFLIFKHLGLIDSLGALISRRWSRRSACSCCGSSSCRCRARSRRPRGSTAARGWRSSGRSCCRWPGRRSPPSRC